MTPLLHALLASVCLETSIIGLLMAKHGHAAGIVVCTASAIVAGINFYCLMRKVKA